MAVPLLQHCGAIFQAEAAAAKRLLQDFLHHQRPGDQSVKLLKFLTGKGLPTGGRRGVGRKTMQHGLDVRDANSRFLRQPHDLEQPHRAFIVAPPAVDLLRRGQQADAFIVAKGGSSNTGTPRDNADGELFPQELGHFIPAP